MKKSLVFIFLLSINAFSQNTQDEIMALRVHNDARKNVGINPLIWSDKLEKQALSYATHLAKTNKFKHSRTIYEIIDSLDISPIKKNLFNTIEKYGIFMSGILNRHSILYISFNPKDRHVFTGIKESITDKNILMYHNTPTIIYQISIQ